MPADAASGSYQYDVFISYSHKDEEWVWKELLPRLETCGLTVCIDERDFEIGVPALINMERAADHSRHTLVVLTPNWVGSEWTAFESLLVGGIDPAGRRRRLQPLMLETCEPPPRIAMLTWADLRRPEHRERNFRRLIRSLGGKVGQSGDAPPAVESGQGVAASSAPEPAAARIVRRRPAGPGDSLSHHSCGAATLGCLVVDRKDPGSLMILSDFSGLCAAGALPAVGDPIIQPGRADGGSRVNTIARLARGHLVRDDPAAAASNVSVAVATVRRRQDVTGEIPGTGFPRGVRAAVEGAEVSMVGRTSGRVSGEVLMTSTQGEVAMPVYLVTGPLRFTSEAPKILFQDIIETTPMLKPGDSGALLVDSEGYALGLGFAGSGETSFFFPMQKVLDVLEVDLVTAEVWAALDS